MSATIGLTTQPPAGLGPESQKWLKVPFPPVAQSYPGEDTIPGPNNDWANQMWSSYFVAPYAGCKELVVTTSLLFGTGWNAKSTGRTLSPQAPTDTTGKGNTPTVMTLADVAAGRWDNMFRPLFKNVAAKFPAAWWRLGQEDYGTNWYAWTGPELEALRTAARNHLEAVARSYSTGFRFIWDVGRSGPGGYQPTLNGAQHVGAIGFDLYDQETLAAALAVIAGAVALGKKLDLPVVCCEWGLWNTDDPVWAVGVFEALLAQVEMALYFDIGSAALAHNPKTAGELAPLMAKAA